MATCWKLGQLEESDNAAMFDDFLAAHGVAKDRPA
jgi:hypothetical protein